jgi:cation transport protein ChaC
MSEIYSTIEKNKNRLNLDPNQAIWLFGYGSIIFKVDFEYLEAKKAYLNGFDRRFWMASEDHRGTPESPGRVLTLRENPKASCFGMAYKIDQKVLKALDLREQNGYLRYLKSVIFADGKEHEALVYIGDQTTRIYQEEHDVVKLAELIFNSVGPSGQNKDYVYELAQALRDLNEPDEYIFELEACLRKLEEIE